MLLYFQSETMKDWSAIYSKSCIATHSARAYPLDKSALVSLSKGMDFHWQDGYQHPRPGQAASRSKLRSLLRNMKIQKITTVPQTSYRRLDLLDGTILWAHKRMCDELLPNWLYDGTMPREVSPVKYERAADSPSSQTQRKWNGLGPPPRDEGDIGEERADEDQADEEMDEKAADRDLADELQIDEEEVDGEDADTDHANEDHAGEDISREEYIECSQNLYQHNI